MSLPVIVRQAAKRELRDAYEWLEGQRTGLGDEFLAQVDKTLALLAQLPELHQLVLKDVRRAPVAGFSYSIFYRVRKGDLVVISVFHSKRDPSIWQRRV